MIKADFTACVLPSEVGMWPGEREEKRLDMISMSCKRNLLYLLMPPSVCLEPSPEASQGQENQSRDLWKAFNRSSAVKSQHGQCHEFFQQIQVWSIYIPGVDLLLPAGCWSWLETFLSGSQAATMETRAGVCVLAVQVTCGMGFSPLLPVLQQPVQMICNAVNTWGSIQHPAGFSIRETWKRSTWWDVLFGAKMRKALG